VSEISNRLNKLELENTELKNLTKKLQARISVLELGVSDFNTLRLLFCFKLLNFIRENQSMELLIVWIT
jgi:hypothetical protein